MSDPNTIRILSLDGGGERGYLSLNFLKLFLTQWLGADGPNTNIASKFDVITGASIGGIMGLGLANGMTANSLTPFFTEQGPYIFTEFYTGIPPINPSQRPSDAYKLGLLLAKTPFYQSSGAYENDYGAGKLVTTMQSTFGSATLANLQTSVLIPSYQTDTNKFVSFSNRNYPNFIGQNELISNVGLATSAAPVYLPTWPFGGHTYNDGGVYLNNPALMGLTLGKMLKPRANRYCILSLGTGIGPNQGSYIRDLSKLNEHSFDNIRDPRIDPKIIAFLKNFFKNNANYINNDGVLEDPFSIIINTFKPIISESTSGSQESVAETLLLNSLYTLDQLYYYRFQPTFTNIPDGEDVELDNTTTTILDYYVSTANNWYNNDISNISTFIGHLTA